MVTSLTEFATMLRSEKVQPFVQTEGALREVHDAITDMMKQLANEPSVGLFFVQQHVHRAVPGMISLKAQIVDNTQEVEYVTQDVRDALNSVRSMKEVGPAVIERMIKTLDSSLPRLASLRPSKRDGHPQDSLVMEFSENQSYSPRSPNSSSVKQSSADNSSSSVDNQSHMNHPLWNRESSAQVPIGKDISRPSTSEGDNSGYARTMLGSAFQKASIVSKWNSYTKSTKIESSSTGVEENLRSNIKPGADRENSPSQYLRNILGTAYNRGSSLGRTEPALSTETSISKDNGSVARDGHEVQEFSGPSLGKTPSLVAFREVTDIGKPVDYMRVVFGSIRQTSGNVTREVSKFPSEDVERPPSPVDKPLEGWSWLQVPRKALRSFNKKPQEEDLAAKTASGEKVILDPVTSGSESKEEFEQLLDIERASYEAFAAEKAAKLEEWLQDTDRGDTKESE